MTAMTYGRVKYGMLRLLQLLSRSERAKETRGTEEKLFPHAEDDSFYQTTFRFAVIALAAKLSQCDGEVREEEWRAFCELFPLPAQSPQDTRRLFALACEDSLPAAHYARLLRQLFPDHESQRRDVMNRLRRIAAADGPVVAAEKQWLDEIAALLGAAEPRAKSPAAAHPLPPSDPYRVLGVTKKASFEEIKKAYRSRIRELHPDSLMAGGSAPEAIAAAGGALASVNAAYGALLKKHKIK